MSMDKDQAKKKMSDIARLAGVSESTVSRALSGSSLVNPQTRARIEAIANEHNYVINKQAQNLRLQSSRTISVIIPVSHEPRQHVSDPFLLELLGSIADALTEADYDLLLSRVNADDWRRKVASHSYVDGLIVIGQSAIHAQINEFVQQSHLPTVVWGAQLPDQKYVSVGCDNYLGGQLAARHLMAIGRKRILFLGDIHLPEVTQRYAGFLAELQSAGIEHDPQLTVRSGFSVESGNAAIQTIIQQNWVFDAIFAASDLLATIAIKSLALSGKRIPHDVAIVGFDGISLAAHMAPSLTTVSQTIYEGGHALVTNLFAQINGQARKNHLLTPHLIVRDSA